MNINQALSYFPSGSRDNEEDEDYDKSDYKSDKKEEGPEINTNQPLSFLVVKTFMYESHGLRMSSTKKSTEIQKQFYRYTEPI